MADARPVRPAPQAGAVRAPRPQHAKPDPKPMRLAFGMAGLASATALLTAMLPSVTPSQVPVADAVDTTTAAVVPQPSVIHVLKTVTLEPGQTAPPNSSVVVRPQPTPRIVVKTVTRQSGK
jgi:hypothetical protein